MNELSTTRALSLSRGIRSRLGWSTVVIGDPRGRAHILVHFAPYAFMLEHDPVANTIVCRGLYGRLTKMVDPLDKPPVFTCPTATEDSVLIDRIDHLFLDNLIDFTEELMLKGSIVDRDALRESKLLPYTSALSRRNDEVVEFDIQHPSGKISGSILGGSRAYMVIDADVADLVLIVQTLQGGPSGSQASLSQDHPDPIEKGL